VPLLFSGDFPPGTITERDSIFIEIALDAGGSDIKAGGTSYAHDAYLTAKKNPGNNPGFFQSKI
jgi:hypothetical protein